MPGLDVAAAEEINAMDKREHALYEALNKNIEEKERWQNYLEDNKSAIQNLVEFSKHLTMDVMVPIGRKAYTPGQLIHTNEVLVGHYQGYFSKCTAHKAKEICQHRIDMAEEHMKKLQTESELWQNKLEKPHLEGVLANNEEREIIEDFIEIEEQRWREKHKLRLRQSKLKERQEREHGTSNNKTDEEILSMLDEAELMEELENELSKLQVDEVNDETVKKLMSGEIKMPSEKPRVAHNETIIEKQTKLQGIVKKTDLEQSISNVIPTNNNVRPNPELISTVAADSDVLEAELPEEVQLIKEQAKFLTPADQIGFYEYQIQIIKQKLLSIPIVSEDTMNEKIHLLSVLEYLEELLEVAEELVGNEELGLHDNDIDALDNEVVCNDNKVVDDKNISVVQQKRRISFALEDETLEFRRNETVADMMPKSKPQIKTKRDIVTLYEPVTNNIASENASICNHLNKKQSILEKVEQNLQYVNDHQSKEDFDMVNKILDTSMGRCHTLHITFKHSNTQYSENNATQQNDDVLDIPQTPADVYSTYIKQLKVQNDCNADESKVVFLNGYVGEDEVHAPVLRESERQQVYEDLRMKFCVPGILKEKNDKETIVTKSILRNKSDTNNLCSNNENNKKSYGGKRKKKKAVTKPIQEDEYMSAYNKVMNDVVEKPLTEPEPLPKGEFIDAHTPKKRISRFKQMRNATS